MLMATHELIGLPLDWSVAAALGYREYVRDAVDGRVFRLTPDGYRCDLRIEDNMYSEDYSLAGGIMDTYRIDVRHTITDGAYRASRSVDAVQCMIVLPNAARFNPKSVITMYGNTALIAAMRCVVYLKLGPEVAVPREIVEAPSRHVIR